MSNIRCPHCDSTSICVLAWISEKGQVLEAAGDYVIPNPAEPKSLCMCSDCDKYWSPHDTKHWITIEEGVPYEMCQDAKEGEKLAGCKHAVSHEEWEPWIPPQA